MTQITSHIIGEDIGLVTLNSPERKNVLSVATLSEMSASIDTLLKSSIRVLVITGSGDSFSAGYDIGLLKEEFILRDSSSGSTVLLGLFEKLESLPVPVIAMVNGFCIGAGFDLASACDFRIAADSSRFGITPAKIGLVYPVEGIRRVSRIVGEGFARELFFTGKIYDADTMCRKGFLVSAVDDAVLHEETMRFAESLAGNSLTAIGGMKKIFLMMHDPAGTGSDFRSLTEDSIGGADLQEGMTAFKEARKPYFKQTTRSS